MRKDNLGLATNGIRLITPVPGSNGGSPDRNTKSRLLTVTQKRRNCYYRIESRLVAKMLESIKAVTMTRKCFFMS